MRTGEGRRRDEEAGFTYLGVLVLIALIGLLLAMAGEVTATTMQRERESELLFIGHEYRDAIGRYFRQNHRYPQSLAELVSTASLVASSGGASPQAVHYLRRLYPDPMTRQINWNLLLAPDQGIMGVASASQKAPIKTAGFDDVDVGFEDAKTYGDWIFVYDPRAALLRRAIAAGNASPP